MKQNSVVRTSSETKVITNNVVMIHNKIKATQTGVAGTPPLSHCDGRNKVLVVTSNNNVRLY